MRLSFWRRRRWQIAGVVAALLLVAGAVDWSRPPQRQFSVQLYQRGVVGSYRSFVRPWTKSFVRCRYRPTCSQYSEMAMRQYGFPRGAWLTIKRVARCGPWVKPGTSDPVPAPSP